MIGIIGAMDLEVSEIISLMSETTSEKISGVLYTRGKLKGQECVVAVSGIGKVNSAICAQTMILRYSPKLVINTGVAGGILKEMKVADIAVATDVVQYDMDTTAVGDPKGLISGINIVNIPCSKSMVEKLISITPKIENTNFFMGTIATGDSFINSNKRLESLREEFNAIACEMEGASIGQVCYINGIDFMVIRAISDNGDDNSHIDYLTFAKIAAQKSISILCRFLESL